MPMNPQANEVAFRVMHLRNLIFSPKPLSSTNIAYQRGSGIAVEFACAGTPLSPRRSLRQEVTSAAIDMTLAIGAKVAAISGIAVEANHQSLCRNSAH